MTTKINHEHVCLGLLKEVQHFNFGHGKHTWTLAMTKSIRGILFTKSTNENGTQYGTDIVNQGIMYPIAGDNHSDTPQKSIVISEYVKLAPLLNYIAMNQGLDRRDVKVLQHWYLLSKSWFKQNERLFGIKSTRLGPIKHIRYIHGGVCNLLPNEIGTMIVKIVPTLRSRHKALTLTKREIN